MSPIDRLSQLFEKFPGIGPRQSRRFVQYLLSAPPSLRQDLSEQIRTLGTQTAQCKVCFRWYTKEGTASECPICASTSRDHSTLFVIEKDVDIDNVERSSFRGVYFVLGGAIPLGAETPERHIRIPELIRRIEADIKSSKIKEIILGLSATTEGDHTRDIIAETLRPLIEGKNITLSALGRGLSTGSELEYADPETIANALSSRS